ncbi:MAG: hypothetical protein FJ387_27765 [Verrucomicrobia bacterium]|nr:hypothetical protein [Verrucomicrobiota bacterium]
MNKLLVLGLVLLVQIEVWDRFDYSQDNWLKHPYNPTNNVNYTTADTGLATAYPAHAWMDRQPFFHTIPGMARYQPRHDRVRHYQERFVAQLLSHSLPYGHVLYCMNNETSTHQAWGQHWMKFIQDKAREQGVLVFTTDMFDDVYAPQKSAKLKQAIDQPALYPFIDVSQVNSRTFNEDHWNNIFWIAQQVQTTPRPLNNTKIYSDGQTTWGSPPPRTASNGSGATSLPGRRHAASIAPVGASV